MLKKNTTLLYLSISAILLTISLSNLMFFLYEDYFIIYSMYSLLYIFAYVYIIFFSKVQLTFSSLLSIFVIIRINILAISFFDSNYAIDAFGLAPDSDAVRFHIDRAINRIHTMDDILYHLFSPFSEYNGRLTHVLIFFYTKILFLLEFDGHNITNIGIITNIFNTIIDIVTINIIYRATFNYSNSLNFARRAVFFLIFNPFFINYTAAPRKETLLFLALSIFIYVIVNMYRGRSSNNYLFLLVVGIILFFDRVYMVPLVFGIYLYIHGKIIYSIFIFILGVLVLDIFIGIEIAFSMYQSHVLSLTSPAGGGSYLGNNHDIFSNFLRTLFSPFFIRPFTSGQISGSILHYLQYIVYILMYYISIKALFRRNGLSIILLFTLMFIWILLPFHSTLKMLILTAFATIFLDNISFIKYSKFKD